MAFCVAVFCHQTAIQSTGFRFLNEGEQVKFETMKTDRGLQVGRSVLLNWL